MADSAAIDNALVAKLGADATLLGLMPNGVYMDVAPARMTRFVIVSLASPRDYRVFGARAIEEALYQIEARSFSGSGADAREAARLAAARIDALLDPPGSTGATLTATGYTLMAVYRNEEPSRIRFTERGDDPTIEWYRYGAYYRVVMSVD